MIYRQCTDALTLWLTTTVLAVAGLIMNFQARDSSVGERERRSSARVSRWLYIAAGIVLLVAIFASLI